MITILQDQTRCNNHLNPRRLKPQNQGFCEDHGPAGLGLYPRAPVVEHPGPDGLK
jgi:hypothetical protein